MTTYRDTGLTVRCDRIMINNPDKVENPNAHASMQFDRSVVVEQAGLGRSYKQVTSCLLNYINDPNEKGYNGNKTFALPTGLVNGVNELTNDQFYGICAALFDNASALQDIKDIAREQLKDADLAMGNNNPHLV